MIGVWSTCTAVTKPVRPEGHSADHVICGTPGDSKDARLVWPQKRRRRIVYIPKPTPLERFNLKNLSVSQLCEQRSCEIKMINMLKEQQKSFEPRRHVPNHALVHIVTCGNPEFDQMGHAKRFGVQMTREDQEALKLLSIVEKMSALEAGKIVKDFPVFGVLDNTFVTGTIDRLHFDKQKKLVLSQVKRLNKDDELFTADSGEHQFQAAMHKLLFDCMVRGDVKRKQFLQHLKLQPQHSVGTEIRGLSQSCSTFGELLEHVLSTMASSKIRRADKLQVIYIVEATDGTMRVQFKETQLRAELAGYLAYWKGKREAHGVDIEDAWKCGSCLYRDDCEWKNNDLVEARMDGRLQLDSHTIERLISGSPPMLDSTAYICTIFRIGEI